jgi:hypothetical protein
MNTFLPFDDPLLQNEQGWLGVFQSGGNRRLIRCQGNAFNYGHGSIWVRTTEPVPWTTVVSMRYDTADLYCGRGMPLGNPYMIGKNGNRAGVIKLFAADFLRALDRDPEFRVYCLSLFGKRLGCHCKPKACHLDPVADWINQQTGVPQ